MFLFSQRLTTQIAFANVAVILCFPGCVFTPSSQPPNELIEQSRFVVAQALKETSGLYCLNDRMLTINDSGNAAELFEIDFQGQLLGRQTLDQTNHDWEAVTVIGEQVVIADIGNNKGKRTDLALLALDRTTGQVNRYPLGYRDNHHPQRNQPYAHNFDAEALTVHNNKLILFSKSWANHITNVYEFDLSQSLEGLSKVTSFAGLPGVITGADWDEKRQSFVIIGYQSDPFGNFDTFLARVSKNFTVQTVWPVNDLKQAEGICVDSAGDYWVSQEASDSEPALLVRFREQGIN